jgi:hypothetical protein
MKTSDGRSSATLSAATRLELFTDDLRSDLGENHPIRRTAHERPGQGVEIVLEVDDVEGVYQHVLSEKWPRSAELRRQPGG